jgi:hypothetical protein
MTTQYRRCKYIMDGKIEMSGEYYFHRWIISVDKYGEKARALIENIQTGEITATQNYYEIKFIDNTK